MDELEGQFNQQALLQVAKKVRIDDGDILLCKVADEGMIDAFAIALGEIHEGKQLLVVNIDHVDILATATDEMMAELGWQRIPVEKDKCPCNGECGCANPF